MDIAAIIEEISILPAASKKILQESMSEVSFPKGHLLFRAGKVERDVYFVKKGVVRAYVDQENSEVTFWFGTEGQTVLSMRSYVENNAGYENIVLLEDCELYSIKSSLLNDLFEKDIHIANWGRRLAEKELIKTEEKLISRQFKTASERYELLIQNNPDLIKRVQLGHIASYLGITQVSLSRIRAEIK